MGTAAAGSWHIHRLESPPSASGCRLSAATAARALGGEAQVSPHWDLRPARCHVPPSAASVGRATPSVGRRQSSTCAAQRIASTAKLRSARACSGGTRRRGTGCRGNCQALLRRDFAHPRSRRGRARELVDLQAAPARQRAVATASKCGRWSLRRRIDDADAAPASAPAPEAAAEHAAQPVPRAARCAARTIIPYVQVGEQLLRRGQRVDLVTASHRPGKLVLRTGQLRRGVQAPAAAFAVEHDPGAFVRSRSNAITR